MTKPKVLCVDDEPAVVEGLQRNLRRGFEVLGASSGLKGLELAGNHPDLAVVISDMRMPEMDGAAFLARCRTTVPDATRILLTGHADLDAAVAAVNKGQIFRFLSKPCPPDQLLEAVLAAAELHRLVTAEKVLLEQTLNGAVRALCDVLAQVHPQAMGRSLRVKELAGDLAAAEHLPDRWQLEVAAMLSQIACVSLPAETLASWEAGAPLSRDEQAAVDRMPQFTDALLGQIPRLEPVRELLSLYHLPPGALAELPQERRKAAQVLRIASDFDRAVQGGLSGPHALAKLRGEGALYDAALLATFAELRDLETDDQVRSLYLRMLEPGMRLAEDLKTATGVLLGARGYMLTETFLARLFNFKQGMVKEPIAVIVRGPGRA
jgi:CheY-like chemotaxis protein